MTLTDQDHIAAQREIDLGNVVFYPPYAENVPYIMAATGWSKKQTLEMLGSPGVESSKFISIDPRRAHKHHLKTDRIMAFATVFRCSRCDETFTFDKFRIRLAVKGLIPWPKN